MLLTASSVTRRLISPRFSFKAASAPPNLVPSQRPYVDAVRSKLESQVYKLESSICPCGATCGVVISEVDRYGLPLTFVLCTACGTIRIDPFLETASLEDFYTRFYQQMYARATDVESYFLKQRSYGQKLLALAKPFLKPESLVFEIGCGAGGALNVFQNKGYQVSGCDYSAELIAAGRERGVRNIYHGSLKDIQRNTGGAKADLIYLHHVFEHVSRPHDLLQECRNHLAPGGRVIAIVPDVSRIDSFPCPAGDLLQFLHIAHKYNFSVEGLRRLGNQAGFKVCRLAPDAKIHTHWSNMPELWIEFVPVAIHNGQGAARAAEQREAAGEKMLVYLKRTEERYAKGLCRGQLLARLSEAKNSIGRNVSRLKRATPAKVIRKLKGV